MENKYQEALKEIILSKCRCLGCINEIDCMQNGTVCDEMKIKKEAIDTLQELIVNNKYQEALNDISVDYDELLKFWKSSFPSYEYEKLNKQVNENILALQELVDKSIPKKVIKKYYQNTEYFNMVCPNCSHNQEIQGTNCCTCCGQRLDWSK